MPEAASYPVIQWLRENGYWNSELVDLHKSSYGGIGVFLRPDAAEKVNLETYSVDESPEIILRVPKSNILSAKNSFLYSLLEDYEQNREKSETDLEVDSEVDLRSGMHAMVLTYIYESAAGPESPWYQYLQSIDIGNKSTSDLENVPICLWPENIKLSMRNTECDLLNMLDNRELIQFFIECVLFAKSSAALVPIPSVLKLPETHLSVDNLPSKHYEAIVYFGRHVQTVISRAFEVDDYHGLSLVPGADLFNHAFPIERDSHTIGQENVHFVSSNEVCHFCGEVECDHEENSDDESDDENSNDDNDDENDDEEGIELDEELGVHSLEAELEQQEDEESTDMSDAEQETLPADDDLRKDLESGETCCDIVLTNPITDGELLNTYGNDLPNAYLLQRYGFANPPEYPNPNDSCLLSVQMFAYLKNYKQKLSTKEKAALENRLMWFEEVGYGAVNEIIQLEQEEHEQDCEERDGCEHNHTEFLDTWQLSLKIEYNGKPSPQTHAFLNLVKMKEREFKALVKSVELNDLTRFTTLLLSESNTNLDIINEWRHQRLKRYGESPTGDSIQEKFIRGIITQEKNILNKMI